MGAIAIGLLRAVFMRVAGAKSFEELHAWKLSARLRDRVVDVLKDRPAPDRDFCEQLRDAARSAPRNIAEGFGAYHPRAFAQFVRIARRSLMETKNHLLDGERSGELREQDAVELLALCNRALGATTAFLRYLDACEGEAPSNWGERGDRTATKKRR